MSVSTATSPGNMTSPLRRSISVPRAGTTTPRSSSCRARPVDLFDADRKGQTNLYVKRLFITALKAETARVTSAFRQGAKVAL